MACRPSGRIMVTASTFCSFEKYHKGFNAYCRTTMHSVTTNALTWTLPICSAALRDIVGSGCIGRLSADRWLNSLERKN